jgi:uracil-DNA glycosylase
MTSSPNGGQPRFFRDRREVERRLQRIDEPHVAPLNSWVRALRLRMGPEAIVPWFDPGDGGVEAKILWLLEAPGPKATVERGGSGFISCDNNDGTAQNTFETRAEAGVVRKDVVHWNAIPCYLGTNTKIRARTRGDMAEAGPLLAELLDLLPALRVVILGGGAAQELWAGHGPTGARLTVIECPHPSPMNVNTRPGNREAIVDAWARAGRIVGAEPAA